MVIIYKPIWKLAKMTRGMEPEIMKSRPAVFFQAALIFPLHVSYVCPMKFPFVSTPTDQSNWTE